MKTLLILGIFVAYLLCVIGFETYGVPIVARVVVAILFGLGVWAVATKYPHKKAVQPQK